MWDCLEIADSANSADLEVNPEIKTEYFRIEKYFKTEKYFRIEKYFRTSMYSQSEMTSRSKPQDNPEVVSDWLWDCDRKSVTDGPTKATDFLKLLYAT